MKYPRIEIILLWFSSIVPFILQGQKGMSLESTVHIGKIFKHSKKLNFDPKDLGYSYGLELNCKFKKYGEKYWHQYHKYPVTGLGLFIYQIGEPAVFGTAVGILPNISFYLVQKRKLNLLFQMGGGIAYLSTHYHPVNNTRNNAIGSNLNNITNFKFQLVYRLNLKWALNSGLSFTHFSNGASQFPNLGINIPAVALGLKYMPQPLMPKDFIHHDEKDTFRRFGFNTYFALAFREHITEGGPRYPIYIASLGGTYKFSPVNRLTVGFEYEFNRAVYVFGLHTFDFESEEEARKRSARWMFFIADELFFGNVSLLGQIGIYLPTDPFLTGGIIYNKLALRYHFPTFTKAKARFFVGIYLKSHKAVAEYFGLGLGISL